MASEKRQQSNGISETNETEDRFVERLHAAAREHYAVAFPNPNRENCPPRIALENAARELPNEDLRRHLFECSACFNEFQALRGAVQEAAAIVSPRRFARLNTVRRPLFAAAFAAVLLLLALGGWAFFALRIAPANVAQKTTADSVQSPPDNSGERSDAQSNTRAEVAVAPPETSTTETAANQPQAAKPIGKAAANAAPQRKANEPAAEPKLLAQNTIRLDLQPVAVYRGAEDNPQTVEKIIELPSKPVRLELALPSDAPVGNYEVGLYDEFGNKLSARSVSRRGKVKLRANFDLRKLDRRRLRLCVSANGEVPDCYPIKITARK